MFGLESLNNREPQQASNMIKVKSEFAILNVEYKQVIAQALGGDPKGRISFSHPAVIG